MEHNEISFVNVCGNTKKDIRATNKIVRAHVMRRYKQQQRVSKRKGHETHVRSAADETASSEACAIQRRFLPSLELTSWLDGELDPFQSLPVRLTRRELMLLQQSESHTHPYCTHRISGQYMHCKS
jgi:hypothetical protein